MFIISNATSAQDILIVICTLVTLHYRGGLIEAKVTYPDTDEVNGNVGKPVSFYGAEDHACGTAVFVDDMKSTSSELHMVLIQARRPHAKILSIDYSKYAMSAIMVDFYMSVIL